MIKEKEPKATNDKIEWTSPPAINELFWRSSDLEPNKVEEENEASGFVKQ